MSIVEVISPDYIKVMSGVGLGVVATLAVTWVRQVDIAHAQQRINAFMRDEDEQDARFLAEHRQRFALPAAPDVTGEVVAVEHHDVDEDAPSDDTERPYLWVLVIVAVVVGWGAVLRGQVGALVAYLRERFKSDEELAREWHDRTGEEPWLLYDEDELRAKGATETELRMLRRGFVPIFDRDTDAEADALTAAIGSRDGSRPGVELDEDRWAEDAAITDGPDTAEPVNREPYRGVGRHWADGTAQHKVIGPGRHEKLINVPAQRDGGEN